MNPPVSLYKASTSIYEKPVGSKKATADATRQVEKKGFTPDETEKRYFTLMKFRNDFTGQAGQAVYERDLGKIMIWEKDLRNWWLESPN